MVCSQVQISALKNEMEWGQLDPERLDRVRRYFEEYFNDEFRLGQGTEEILETLAESVSSGDWLDLGSGSSTLFWSIPLSNIESISCCDVSVEALKILHDFVADDSVPTCYKQVLARHRKPIAHLDDMKGRVTGYYVFDAMTAWPQDFAEHTFDLVTEFGLFGLSPSPDEYLLCFDRVRTHLRPGARIIGADWIRSPLYVQQEGHDNSYVSEYLIHEGIRRAGCELLSYRHASICGDPLYDAVIVWEAGNP